MRAARTSAFVLVVAATSACGPCAPARLDAIGPRVLSNQASYPVVLYGEHLPEGARLVLGPPASLELPTARIDGRHLTARIPPIALPAAAEEQAVSALLVAAGGQVVTGQVSLTIVNDAGYPMPAGLALSPDGSLALSVSATTSELWVWRLHGPPAPPERIAVAQGPRAVAVVEQGGKTFAVVAHDFAAELRLVDLAAPRAEQQRIAVRGGSLTLVIDNRQRRIYLGNHQCSCVQVVDLERGRVVAEWPAGVRPQRLQLSADGKLLAVGNGGSDDVSLIDTDTGRQRRVQPRQGTPIAGGHNEAMAPFVIGGKAPRALAFSDRRRALFVATAGLNVGPNPERSEVSTNGGVDVLDAASGKVLRHVSLLAGIPSALAIDDERGLVYAADLSRGLLTVLEVDKALASNEAARGAVVASLPLPIPEGADLMRPAADFGVDKRAGLEVHAGPAALALARGGRALFVLSRFHGTLTELDVSDPRGMRVVRTLPGLPMGELRRRRLGETLWFTDLGRSSMSCDACHPDGGDDGVFYAKNHPQRLYRSPSLRDARETPPYFFPAAFPSLEVTAAVVLRRNRFSNPLPSRREIDALTAWQRTIIALPNPNAGPRGELPDELSLPDGRRGSPRRGLAIYEGKAGCSSRECHPAPHFTADQDQATRGAVHDVGTPVALAVRPELQEAPAGPRATPSLIGVWDEFPLLQSGAGGLDVDADGTVVPRYPFALRRVLEMPGSERHGNAAGLTAAERDDLLAYLMML